MYLRALRLYAVVPILESCWCGCKLQGGGMFYHLRMKSPFCLVSRSPGLWLSEEFLSGFFPLPLTETRRLHLSNCPSPRSDKAVVVSCEDSPLLKKAECLGIFQNDFSLLLATLFLFIQLYFTVNLRLYILPNKFLEVCLTHRDILTTMPSSHQIK